MKIALRLIATAWVLCSGVAVAGEPFSWRTDILPKLPVEMMNHAVGVHNGALIVAGGRSANPKTLEIIGYDAIYALEPGWNAWKLVGKLPSPLMAMGCASDAAGMYLVGGFDGTQNSDLVLRLRYDAGKVEVAQLASKLPIATSSGASAIYQNTLYLAGGIARYEGDIDSVGVLLSLDLTDPKAVWNKTNRVPGLERIGSIVTAGKDGVYVVGGLPWGSSVGQTGVPSIDDAYRFSPTSGWVTLKDPITDFKRVPALAYGPSHLLLMGAGGRAENAKSLMGYDTVTQTWAKLGTLPDGRANTDAVLWNGMIVIPGGEYKVEGQGSIIEDSVLTGTPQRRDGAFGILDYAVVGLYFLAMIGMGVYFSRRESTTDQFFLGGRSVPWWAVGISIFGASVSSITYLTFPAKAYATDWVYLAANLSFLLIVPLIVWAYIPAFRRGNYKTAYEYLEKRFNLGIRVYGSIVFLLFQLGRIAIVLYLPALVLSAASGLDMTTSILLMGVITTIYTVLGGVEAVIWTDVVQAVVLIGGALVAFGLALSKADGGPAGLFPLAEASGKLHWFKFAADPSIPAFWVVLIGNAFAMFYPTTACQTIVQRYFTTATDKEAKRAVWVNALITVPVTFLFFALGTALWGYFRIHPDKLDPTLPTDAILPVFVMAEFPVGIRAALLAGVFAAAMSALSASMNSLAAVAVYDYYKRFVPELSETRALWSARVATLAVGVVGTGLSLVIAWMNAPSMLDGWFHWLGLIGGGLSGIVALGVFTKRAHGRGAVVGAVVSGCTMAWFQTTSAHFFLYGAVGFLVAFCSGYVASLLIPRSAR